MLIFIGSSGYEFYKNMILPSGSEDGSFGFFILGRAPELWIGQTEQMGVSLLFLLF